MSMLSANQAIYPYDKYVEDLMCLQSMYPDRCRIRIAGKSVFWRNIYQVSIGNTRAANHLIILANLHAREYMTTQLCMKQIEHCLANYHVRFQGSRLSDTLTKTALHFFPSCNPDGTAISQFEKGKERWKANGRGVDLNRNWDSAFRYLWKEGKRGLSGEKPESEPEVQAILKAADEMEERGKIEGIISYHASGSIIYGRCADVADERVKRDTDRMCRLAEKITGYEVMPVENVEDTIGCSREYFLYQRKIPFITIEIGRGECPLEIEELDHIWRENKDIIPNLTNFLSS